MMSRRDVCHGDLVDVLLIYPPSRLPESHVHVTASCRYRDIKWRLNCGAPDARDRDNQISEQSPAASIQTSSRWLKEAQGEINLYVLIYSDRSLPPGTLPCPQAQPSLRFPPPPSSESNGMKRQEATTKEAMSYVPPRLLSSLI